ncbi:hypothetical protein VNO77_35156 [Canavalia gladiata]|uniref:Uncharacterized protein n=1 Tax=Canavalia gladiata TaxID=3824 RepID=A0AAN9KG74_CANGL
MYDCPIYSELTFQRTHIGKLHETTSIHVGAPDSLGLVMSERVFRNHLPIHVQHLHVCPGIGPLFPTTHVFVQEKPIDYDDLVLYFGVESKGLVGKIMGTNACMLLHGTITPICGEPSRLLLFMKLVRAWTTSSLQTSLLGFLIANLIHLFVMGSEKELHGARLTYSGLKGVTYEPHRFRTNDVRSTDSILRTLLEAEDPSLLLFVVFFASLLSYNEKLPLLSCLALSLCNGRSFYDSLGTYDALINYPSTQNLQRGEPGEFLPKPEKNQKKNPPTENPPSFCFGFLFLVISFYLIFNQSR